MGSDFQTVSGLSHVAIRTRSILDSIRYYTDILGLKEAFRMYGEDGSLATVYMILAPGQYLELFSGGTRVTVDFARNAFEINYPDGTAVNETTKA